MILTHPILAIVALGAAVVYWLGFCSRGPSVGKTTTKVLAILPLLIFVASLGDRTLLLAALVLCLIGDILLSLKGDRAFLAGVGSFALGHVAYILLFLTHAEATPGAIFQMPFVMVVVGLIVVAVLVAPALFRGAGSLRFAVLAYVPMIVGMGIAGFGFATSEVLHLVCIGALFFVASDLVLGLEMFVLREGALARKIAPFWVWATYWVAQVLIVIGLA